MLAGLVLTLICVVSTQQPRHKSPSHLPPLLHRVRLSGPDPTNLFLFFFFFLFFFYREIAVRMPEERSSHIM